VSGKRLSGWTEVLARRRNVVTDSLVEAFFLDEEAVEFEDAMEELRALRDLTYAHIQHVNDPAVTWRALEARG
jgi:hypothetical protein